MFICNRIASVLVWLGLLAWVLGGLGERVHALDHGAAGHVTVAAAGDEGPSATASASTAAEHACAYELIGTAADLPDRPPAVSTVVRPLRAVAMRAPGSPRGPPPLRFAPKTSPPSAS